MLSARLLSPARRAVPAAARRAAVHMRALSYCRGKRGSQAGRWLQSWIQAAAATGVLLAANDRSTTLAQGVVNLKDVERDIVELVGNDRSKALLLVRLAWHSSGTYCKETKTGGSEGATMRFEPEASFAPNEGLTDAREMLDILSAKYPDLSVSDLWILAGNVALASLGVSNIGFKSGRVDRDGEFDGDAYLLYGRLFDTDCDTARLIKRNFNRMGFDERETVALMGAYTILFHRKEDLNNQYFKDLLENKWTLSMSAEHELYENESGTLTMLPSDVALVRDGRFEKHVQAYAKNNNLFLHHFKDSYRKLTELGVGEMTSEENEVTVARSEKTAIPAAGSMADAPTEALKPRRFWLFGPRKPLGKSHFFAPKPVTTMTNNVDTSTDKSEEELAAPVEATSLPVPQQVTPTDEVQLLRMLTEAKDLYERKQDHTVKMQEAQQHKMERLKAAEAAFLSGAKPGPHDDEAEAILRGVHVVLQQVFGANDFNTIQILCNLGTIMQRRAVQIDQEGRRLAMGRQQLQQQLNPPPAQEVAPPPPLTPEQIAKAQQQLVQVEQQLVITRQLSARYYGRAIDAYERVAHLKSESLNPKAQQFVSQAETRLQECTQLQHMRLGGGAKSNGET